MSLIECIVDCEKFLWHFIGVAIRIASDTWRLWKTGFHVFYSHFFDLRLLFSTYFQFSPFFCDILLFFKWDYKIDTPFVQKSKYLCWNIHNIDIITGSIISYVYMWEWFWTFLSQTRLIDTILIFLENFEQKQIQKCYISKNHSQLLEIFPWIKQHYENVSRITRSV